MNGNLELHRMFYLSESWVSSLPSPPPPVLVLILSRNKEGSAVTPLADIHLMVRTHVFFILRCIV